jgi:hypothetical protein
MHGSLAGESHGVSQYEVLFAKTVLLVLIGLAPKLVCESDDVLCEAEHILENWTNVGAIDRLLSCSRRRLQYRFGKAYITIRIQGKTQRRQQSLQVSSGRAKLPSRVEEGHSGEPQCFGPDSFTNNCQFCSRVDGGHVPRNGASILRPSIDVPANLPQSRVAIVARHTLPPARTLTYRCEFILSVPVPKRPLWHRSQLQLFRYPPRDLNLQTRLRYEERHHGKKGLRTVFAATLL